VNSEYWIRVRSLFAAALERPAGERRRFLLEACDDEGIRAEVLSLLDSHEGDPDWLEAPVIPLGGGRAEGGRRVGPYRTLERIGEGGMGDVYAAERADGSFQRRVALKLVKPGLDTRAVLARFEAERRILARLEHPAIARLYDAGATAEGRPWLAMELVDGEPITRYADRRELPVRDRLELFLQVCDAVDHAHRNLVIHRDVKPQNVLVRPDGAVRLVDFGVAKVLEGDATDNLTGTGERPMTRRYAAPEQVRGAPVSTATDVYALGLLLYELLTSRRPFDPGDSHALEQAILGDDPPPPSSLVPRLDRDLDTICRVALRKDPAERYGSVAALAADLRRHLAGRPIEARRPSALYHARKLVSRHRTAAAVALAALALAVGGVTAYSVQITRERDRARAESAKAEQVAGLLVELFEASNPRTSPGGDTLRVSAFLEAGERRVRNELRGQPEVQARLLALLAEIHHVRTDYDRARALYARTLELHEQAGNEARAAESFLDLAVLEADAGTAREAERLLRQALERLRRIHDEDHPLVARAMNRLGGVLPPGDPEKRPLLEEALALRIRSLGDAHPDIARSLRWLAEERHSVREYQEAITLTRRALAVARKTLPDDHPEIVSNLNNLAVALELTGQIEAADSLNREVLRIKRRTVGPVSEQVANTLNNMGTTTARRGDMAAAERLFREALDTYRQVLGDDHRRVWNARRNLARALQLQGRYRDALPHFEEAVDGARRVRGSDPLVGGYLLGLARLLVDLDRPDEALAAVAEARGMLEASNPSHGRQRSQADQITGLAELRRGGPRRAVRALTRALEARLESGDPDGPQVADVRCSLARALAADGRRQEAQSHLDRCLPVLERWSLAHPEALASASALRHRLAGGD
jgi:serine/threonine-protein kinase